MEEAIVFRNADTGPTELPFSFHVAFQHPDFDVTNDLRESIEIRAACFYDKEGEQEKM